VRLLWKAFLQNNDKTTLDNFIEALTLETLEDVTAQTLNRQREHDRVHRSLFYTKAYKQEFFENNPDYSCNHCYPVREDIAADTQEFLAVHSQYLATFSGQTQHEFRAFTHATERNEIAITLYLIYSTLRFQPVLPYTKFLERIRQKYIRTPVETTDDEQNTEEDADQYNQETDQEEDSDTTNEDNDPTITLNPDLVPFPLPFADLEDEDLYQLLLNPPPVVPLVEDSDEEELPNPPQVRVRMNFGAPAIPQFDRTQNPAEWINAIKVNAVLHSLNPAATLEYAKLMVPLDMQPIPATVDTMAALQLHLENAVINNGNHRMTAR